MRPKNRILNKIIPITRSYLKRSKRFVLFLFILFFLIYFFSLVNKSKNNDNYKRPRIKFKFNNLNKPLHQDKNLTNKFWNLIEKECDPSILKIHQTCLEAINEFDKQLDYTLKNKDNCNECNWLKLNENQKIFYHVFWKFNSYNPNSFDTRVMYLNIMSYLATQNLCCTKLIFWKLAQFPNELVEVLSKKFKAYIDIGSFEIKTFDLNELCLNEQSSFHDKNWCKSTDLSSIYSIDLSDFVRFFVLDSYGGIYTDGDVIYLKDMRIFWGSNFAYRWSFTQNFNTAIMGLNNKNDPYLKYFILHLKNGYNDVNSLVKAVHPYSMTDIIKINLKESNIFKNNIIKMFHTGLFDPAWLCYDGITPRFGDKYICNFDEFANKEFISESEFKKENFFPGAFTYHIHLKNAFSDIKKSSYLKFFENYYNSVLILD